MLAEYWRLEQSQLSWEGHREVPLAGGPMFRDGDGFSTRIGFQNANRQRCHGTAEVKGTDHLQYAYRLECTVCGYVYGANGSDIAERRCPECQGGAPGIRYWR